MDGVSRGKSREYQKHPASGLVCHFSPAAAWPVSGQSALGTVTLFRTPTAVKRSISLVLAGSRNLAESFHSYASYRSPRNWVQQSVWSKAQALRWHGTGGFTEAISEPLNEALSLLPVPKHQYGRWRQCCGVTVLSLLWLTFEHRRGFSFVLNLFLETSFWA